MVYTNSRTLKLTITFVYFLTKIIGFNRPVINAVFFEILFLKNTPF